MLNYRLHAGTSALLLLSFLSCMVGVSSAVAADLQQSSASQRRASPRQVADTKLIAQSNVHALQSDKAEASQQLPKQSAKTDATQQSTSPNPRVKTIDLVNALRKTKLIDPSYKLGATASGDQIVISTE